MQYSKSEWLPLRSPKNLPIYNNYKMLFYDFILQI